MIYVSDRIYPPEYCSIAIEMPNKDKELLTDFNPDRYNFVKRNRIIASISDYTIIVELAEKKEKYNY